MADGWRIFKKSKPRELGEGFQTCKNKLTNLFFWGTTKLFTRMPNWSVCAIRRSKIVQNRDLNNRD